MRYALRQCGLPLLAAVLVLAVSVGPAAAQDDAAKPGGSSKSLLDFIRAGSVVGYVIIALSFAGIALVIDAFVHLKDDKLLPPAIFRQCDALARTGKFSEMLTFCQAGDSMLAQVVGEALEQGQLGIDAVRETMQESGTRAITRLQQRVGYIGFIAAIAPMLGLLGTVTGMIRSFDVLGASKGAARPDELAVGISEALVTTCMGLVVAVPLMFFHNYFRDRVTRIGQAASGQCERLLRVMTAVVGVRTAAQTGSQAPQSTARGPAATPAAGTAPPAAGPTPKTQP
jgi:biopolymer transport protein ExbB